MKNIVELLIEKNKKISTMESCTGGAIANYITNIPDASRVFAFSAVTYSNEYKIKMGVSKEIIDKYTVYSMEVANEMAKVISFYTNSNYGVGITGKLKKADENNMFGEDDVVYLSIYDKDHDKFYNEKIRLKNEERNENKNQILEETINILNNILKKNCC